MIGRILKCKFFWLSIVCFVIAIGFAICNPLINPISKPIKQLEKSIHKEDEDIFVECFEPDLQEDMFFQIDEAGFEELIGLERNETINILQSRVVEANEEYEVIDVFFITNKYEECVDLSVDTFRIEKIDGKEYITNDYEDY